MISYGIFQVQKLYGKYLRAESFKKALIYQKKYLLFLVGGFQDTEALTLSMIAKLGSGPDRFQPEYRMSPALMRFRAGARVIIALWRMKYLVKKWSKGVMRVGEKHHRSKRESTRKSPMNSTENSPVQNSINAKILSTDGNHRNVPGQFVASAARSNRPTGNNENSYRERSKDTLSERNRLSVQNLSKGHSSNSESSSTDHDINQNYVKSKTEPKIYKDLLGDDNQIGRPTINGHSKPAMSGHDRHALNSHEYRPQSTGNYPLKRRVEKLGTDVNQRLSGRPDYSVNSHKDQSPPRAYPRPLSPKVDRASLAGRDIDRHSRQHGRSPSPSQHSSGRRSNSPLRNRSLSPVNQTASPSSGLDEANSSLNAYIRKLESLQARLRNSERGRYLRFNVYDPRTMFK